MMRLNTMNLIAHHDRSACGGLTVYAVHSSPVLSSLVRLSYGVLDGCSFDCWLTSDLYKVGVFKNT